MKLKAKAYSVVLHITLVALAGMVIVLARQNIELERAMAPPAGSELEIGQAVEPLELRSLDGSDQLLDFAGGEKDRLLLVFTTTCPACKENQAAWRTLQENVGNSLDIVGISFSGVEETLGYRETHDLKFPIAVPVDRTRIAESLSISAVPMTIRIGTDGRVRGSWLGALSEAQVAEASLIDHG